MLTYPNIDPIALQLGPIRIYWYGCLYLLSFLLGFWLCKQRALKEIPPWTTEQVIDLIFYVALGVIFGGTIGDVLFYAPETLLQDPLRLLRFWEAGRSFHGGFMGVLIAVYLYCVKSQRRFLKVTDFIAPVVPLGLAAGRLGNFINGELWGRVTDVPWAMIFPYTEGLPRHPSQLYECLLEGVLLFVILHVYTQKPRAVGAVSGLFALGYGVFRFLIEFLRAPDPVQGFLAWEWLTMGQLLSLPLIMLGIILLWYAKQGLCLATQPIKG
jgi:phosphatidylglycerol:prolipoprotein diacylglycerol transferase